MQGTADFGEGPVVGALPPPPEEKEKMVPVVIGSGAKTVDVPESKVVDFIKDLQQQAKSVAQLDKIAAEASAKMKGPTHQMSTLGFLFIFFGLIFLCSYLVHRAGGPHKVEAAVDRFFLRAKGTITGRGGGRYAPMRGNDLPR